ncbi:MAG: hypothetical protein ACKPKO_05870, partial [Candidatus Fonsibacter sp.]
KVIKDRLKWRPYPMRRSSDTEEGGDLYSMDKIRELAQEGYAPFFLKKGLVDPWVPIDRWHCPAYAGCKDLPGSDVMIEVAKIVDVIELQGKTDLMWTQDGQSNSYRDDIRDKICMKFFGSTDPSDRDVKTTQQKTALSLFRNMTISRAKQAGSFRDVAREVAEKHAAKML